MLRVLAVVVLVGLSFAAEPPLAAQDDPRLDELFAALRVTQDPAEGGRLGRRIADIWGKSGDPAIDRLMREGRRHLDYGDLLAALKSFERVTQDAPGFAEGWTKRAQVLYQMGDFAAAETSPRERHRAGAAPLPGARRPRPGADRTRPTRGRARGARKGAGAQPPSHRRAPEARGPHGEAGRLVLRVAAPMGNNVLTINRLAWTSPQ